MTHTSTAPAVTPIQLPASVQHFIVPILMIVAVLGAGAPTLFGSIHAAHGNGLLIAGAVTVYVGILITALLTFTFRWTWLKLVLQVLSVLIAIIVPFLIKGVFVPEVDGPVLAVAVANGLLTAFGQYVRTQTVTKPVIDARASNVVTSLPDVPTPPPGYELDAAQS